MSVTFVTWIMLRIILTNSLNAIKHVIKYYDNWSENLSVYPNSGVRTLDGPNFGISHFTAFWITFLDWLKYLTDPKIVNLLHQPKCPR